MERHVYYSSMIFIAYVLSASAFASAPPFKLGVENMSDELLAWLRTCRVGLIMNHTSRDQQNHRTVDILLQHKIPIALLFAPEHGLDGTLQAYKDVHDTHDTHANIPVASVYVCGRTHHAMDHKFKNLDVLIFDIQDCGMRHFTYISTLLHMMECAVRYQLPFIVLDRPNPLGGCMEGPVGNLLPLPHVSLTPIAIPLRYGLTIGELARYFNHHALNNAADVRVVRMQGYQRTTEPIPVACYSFSPNIQNKQACHGYSFLGLLGEIRPFDVAINTENSFQCLLLPEDIPCTAEVWASVRSQLKKLGINSSLYSYTSVRKKKRCKGLKLTVPTITTTSMFQAFLMSVQVFKKAGVPIVFSNGFDTAAGSDTVRLFLNGTLDKKTFINTINTDVHTFFDRVKPLLLYAPVPHIIELS